MCDSNKACKCKCPKKEKGAEKGGCCKPFKKAKENDKPAAPQNPPASPAKPSNPPQP